MGDPSQRPWFLGGEAPLSRPAFALAALLVVGVALAIWAQGYRAGFQGLRAPDAHDYAQIGRQLARGEGASSLQGFPYVLGWLDAHGRPATPPWPNLHRFPLPPLLIATAYRVAGVGDLGAILPSALFFAGTALLVFALGARVYGPLAGGVAAGLYATSRTQLDYALTPLTETATGFFLVGIALAAHAVAARPQRRLPALGLGVLIGIACLERYNLALVGGVAGLLLGLGPQRVGWRALVPVAAGFALALAPWIALQLVRYGAPLVYLTADRNLLAEIVPGDIFFSLQQYEPWRRVASEPGRMLAKLTDLGPLRQWHALFGRELPWLAPLFALGVVAQRAPARRALWLFGALSFAVTALAYEATASVARFYHPFAPLLLVPAVGGVLVALRRLPEGARGLVPAAAFAALVALGAPPLTRLGGAISKRPPDAILYDAVRALVAPGELIASPLSWRLAWYADRPSLRFRGDFAELARIDRELAPVGAILAPAETAVALRAGLARSALGPEFAEEHALPGGARLWLRGPCRAGSGLAPLPSDR